MPPTLLSRLSFCFTALTILLSPPSLFHTLSKFFLTKSVPRVSPCSISPFPYLSSLTNMSTLLLLVRSDLPHIPVFVLTYISRCHRLEILPRLCHLALLRGCLPLVLCVYDEYLPLVSSLTRHFSPPVVIETKNRTLEETAALFDGDEAAAQIQAAAHAPQLQNENMDEKSSGSYDEKAPRV